MHESTKTLPQYIQQRFIEIEDEVGKIIDTAESVKTHKIQHKVSFRYEGSVTRDILTEFERAQSVCFVNKYETLPTLEVIKVVESNGKYHIEDFDYIRYMLNEYRPIIANQWDSVYYQNIHKLWRSKLINRDTSKDLVITVFHEDRSDVTEQFSKMLDETIRSIRIVLSDADYNYIYNGILQHSDHKFTDRFWKEYMSGELNYVFIKNAKLLTYIKASLYWHYRIINTLTFPKLGPL